MSPQVGILMGSSSDFEVMKESIDILKKFGVSWEIEVSSAHRTPTRTAEYASGARGRGLKVIIAGAGAAAHLAGVIAGHTTLPVVAVPIDSSPLKGFDALLATVQMPGGIPVACMAVGKAGAKNAGIFAAQILAVTDNGIATKLDSFKKEMEAGVIQQSEELNKKLLSEK